MNRDLTPIGHHVVRVLLERAAEQWADGHIDQAARWARIAWDAVATTEYLDTEGGTP